MMIPIAVRSSEEFLRAIPNSLREGAMALLASAIGSYTGRHFKLSTQQIRVLVCASAAAALAAVYNAPIGGSLFALEILMGNFALEVLGPVVVVSVISTLVFRSAMGNLPRFVVPHYELVSAWELLPYLGLGLLSGLISLLFMSSLFTSQNVFEKLPGPKWIKPAIGMTLVGVIGVWFPHVYGNGFETVNLTLQGAKELTLTLLLLLIPMKILASSLTFGSGGHTLTHAGRIGRGRVRLRSSPLVSLYDGRAGRLRAGGHGRSPRRNDTRATHGDHDDFRTDQQLSDRAAAHARVHR